MPADAEWDAGLRLGDDCAALVLVNHRRRESESTVELHNLPFAPAVVYDMATMVEVAFAGTAETLTLKLEIDDMNGRVLGLYPERVNSNRLDGVPSTIRRGETLSYRAIVENGAGEPARGNHIIDLEVKDPHGRIGSRYGGRKATTAGVYEKSQPLALNELPGEWILSIYERYSRIRSEVRFTVT